ncbi:MAG: hypothetical protein H6719_34655 [Sandaracinaceae bacterium]|nr:hypothetical protein [Sandaracinaceae bacterium]
MGSCVDGVPDPGDAGVPPDVDAGDVPPGLDSGVVGDVDASSGEMDAGRPALPPGGSSPGCACRAEPRGAHPLYGLFLAPLALFFLPPEASMSGPRSRCSR